MRRAEVLVDAGDAGGELNGVALAEQHHARPSQLGDGGAVAVGNVVLQQAAARHRRDARDVEVVLHRIRDALKRPSVLAAREFFGRPGGFGQGALPGHRGEGLERRIEPLDAVEEMLGDLERRQRALPVGAAEVAK